MGVLNPHPAAAVFRLSDARMTPRQLQIYLQSLLQEVLETRDILGARAGSVRTRRVVDLIASVESFDEAELLTKDKGLIVTAEDGVEFRITIVRRPNTKPGGRNPRNAG